MSSSIPASTPGKPWQPPAPEVLAPELPQYEILGLLGRGGMGAVYKARQKSLDREVAIKVLPPTIEDADMHYADRFIAEARAMAKLEHSNIIAVYDAGQTPGGLLYFVMQYVQGTDVAQMIHSSGRLPPEHAYAITAHVCEALAYAHRNGIIHRDIKPANIMVDMEGRVKVADFGLAKAVDAQTGFTQSNMAVGTPDFVAPEALVPGMGVDGRADLYAVGVMLYQMLTGSIPRGAFKPASVMVPGLDARFDQIVFKAMQTDREERHRSATELRQHLDSLLLPAAPAPDLQRYSSAGMAKTPPAQSRPGVATARPAAAAAKPDGRAKATPVPRSTPTPPPAKSKTPLFIGLGAAAAISIGAFAMLGGKKAKPSSPLAPSSETSVVAVPKPAPAPPKPVLASPSAPSSQVPSAPASSSSVEFPPGKWVKVFTKFEDLPEHLRKPEFGAKFENGWLKFGSYPGYFNLSPKDFRAAGIRVRTMRQSGAVELQFAHKLGKPSVLINDGTKITLKWQGPPNRQYQAETISSSLTEPVLFEAYFIAGTLYGRSPDRLLKTEIDPSLLSEFCRPVLDLARDSGLPIRDIEVINLDGLPEAEALKILGVDEKGNDLRQKPAAVASATPAASSPTPAAAKSAMAPASSSPSLPISKSSPTFPAGQWVNTTSSVLRDNVKRVQSVDDWLIAAKTGSSLRLNGPDAKNQGVRCILRAQGGRISTIGLESEGISNKIEVINNEVALTQHAHSLGRGSEQLTKLKLTPLVDGAVHVIELYRLGDRLIGRFDKLLLTASLESSVALTDCFPAAMNVGNNDIYIRDIEVINLDGIPEAEALRIIGVDEKGNDLRALAAEQEQRKAEMAKQLDDMAAIPELKTLHEQFVKLQGERVTAPFEKDLAALNTSYLGGLERKMAELKQKGDLDGVLALEAEKKLIADKQPMPAEDDATTAPALKPLRQIYRDTFAKHEATRAANLKALTDPLSIRLKQLESTLTQQNRVPDAKVVREYREGLGKSNPELQPVPSAQTGKGNESPTSNGEGLKPGATLPEAKYSQREVLEWLLSLGAVVGIKDGSGGKSIMSGDKIPPGKITILRIEHSDPNQRWNITDDDFEKLSGLTDLVKLDFPICLNVTGAGLALLGPLPSLEYIDMAFSRFDPANFANMPDFPKLRAIVSLPGPAFTAADFASMPPLKALRTINAGDHINDENLPAICARSKLTALTMPNNRLTDEGLAALTALRELESLGISGGPGTRITGSGLKHLVALPKLRDLTVGNAPLFEAKNAVFLTELKGLTTLRISGGDLAGKDEWIKHLSALKGSKLSELTLSPSVGFTNEQVAALKKALTKVEIKVN